MLFAESLIAGSVLAVIVLLVVALRARAGAERAMCLEAMRSDALGRLAHGDPMDQILGVLAATVHLTYPLLRCSIRLTRGPAPADDPSASQTTLPVKDSSGAQLASVIVEHGSGPLRQPQSELIGRIVELAAVVIEHRTLHHQWQHEASHDWLTGMANRRVFTRKMQTLDLPASPGQRAAIFFIDLDRFKQINDGYGHHAGDLFLREAAQRIRACFSARDLVARMGGDEFMVFAEGLTTEDAERTCERIAGQFRQPFSLNGSRLFGSASIGVSLWPDDGITAAEIHRSADWALYEAKEQGRSQFRVYAPAMRRREESRAGIDQLIRQALDSGLFELFYQPQVSGTGELVGLEALVRIRHPERGLIMPDDFISVAEESGLIAQIDSWVLSEACRQQAAWRKAGRQTVRVAVNMSRASLSDAGLADRIESALWRAEVQPSWIQIEITETAALQEGDVPRETLRKLHEAGISLALDDFGKGTSSLSCLHSLPVDTVKIDKSFVHHLSEGAHLLPFIQAIIGVAKALRLVTVAEGIETAEQAAVMRSLGCDVLQGFHISPPVPATDVPGDTPGWEDFVASARRLAEALGRENGEDEDQEGRTENETPAGGYGK